MDKIENAFARLSELDKEPGCHVGGCAGWFIFLLFMLMIYGIGRCTGINDTIDKYNTEIFDENK